MTARWAPPCAPRMTSRWAPPCAPHPSGWRGAHDRAGLSVRALSSSPRPRAGTTAAPPRGMEGLAGARRSGRGDTGRRPGASRFRVLTTVLAAPPSRCPQDVERDRPVRALSPTGPRPAAVHQAVLARLATPSPRETPPLAVPHRRDGGSPSLSGRRISLLRPHFIGAEVIGILSPRRVFQYKVIFNISFAVSATPT